MRVGSYRHKVLLQNATTTKNASTGQQTKTWRTAATQMASIAPVQGRAYFQAQGDRAEITHEIRTRYNPDVTITIRDRVVFGSRTFEIRSVINERERDREWVLMCVETVSTDDA